MKVGENTTIVTCSSKFWSCMCISPPTSLLRVNSALILFHLNTVIFFVCVCRRLLSCSVNVQQSRSNLPVHTLTQMMTCSRLKSFQHTTFPSEDLAVCFLMGMCPFSQTYDGHQLLAANVPGTLPAYQLPVLGKLPGFPPGR